MILIKNKAQWDNKNHLGRALNKLFNYKIYSIAFNDFTQNLNNLITRSRTIENLLVKYWY